jgi:hypothetical protein
MLLPAQCSTDGVAQAYQAQCLQAADMFLKTMRSMFTLVVAQASLPILPPVAKHRGQPLCQSP